MEVDPAEPCMREFTLIPFKDHIDGGVLHDGFGIEVSADYHLFKADKYKAWLRSPNEVVVQLPTADTAFLHQYSSYDSTRDKLQVLDKTKFSETYEVARMVVRNKLLDNMDRQTYKVLLKFPSTTDVKLGGFDLTNAVFTPARVPYGLIDPQVVPQGVEVIYGPDSAPKKTHNLSIRLAWKISIVESEPRRAIQAPSANPSEKTLESAIQSMSF
jgi:hypothetical protein